MRLGIQDNQRIAEQAARYLGALTEGNEERESLFAWLAESPRHVEEFLLVLRAAQAVAEFTEEQERRIGGIEEEIREGNVVRLEESGEAGSRLTLAAHSAQCATLPPRTRRRGKEIRWGAIAAAIVVAAGLGWWLLPVLTGWQTYATAVGEQRTVKLADGSMVLLNTDSRLKVRFSDDERTLQLTTGEALFTAARDASRPFRVYAGDTVVQAVGTQFGVYRSPTGTRISVLEGVVQIGPESRAAQTPRLAAGEQASVAADGEIVSRGRLDPVKAVAWRQRRLVFEDETLAAIVAEFNRYNIAPQIRVLDETAAARRFSGTFDADEPETMINTLVGDDTLAVTRSAGEIALQTRR